MKTLKISRTSGNIREPQGFLGISGNLGKSIKFIKKHQKWRPRLRNRMKMNRNFIIAKAVLEVTGGQACTAPFFAEAYRCILNHNVAHRSILEYIEAYRGILKFIEA